MKVQTMQQVFPVNKLQIFVPKVRIWKTDYLIAESWWVLLKK